VKKRERMMVEGSERMRVAVKVAEVVVIIFFLSGKREDPSSRR